MLESMKIAKAHKETWVPKMAKNGSTPKTANTQLISVKSPGTSTGGHHVRAPPIQFVKLQIATTERINALLHYNISSFKQHELLITFTILSDLFFQK